jgi:hypothetical protein
MSDVVLLGPQFRDPVLRDVFARTGIATPVCAITAGWQEREGELADLEDHLGIDVTDLRLYERADTVFARDPDLHAAYRERQARLRDQQGLYRVRLAHAKAALHEIEHQQASSDVLKRSRRAALAALRRLDREHMAQLVRIHGEFQARWRPARRAAMTAQMDDLRRRVERTATVLIAGGHVAVLMNRLGLFSMARLLRGKRLVGWSAGAMALTEHVVLFHDHDPVGRSNAEVFESGLGSVRGVVALPHALTRLALDDAARVGLLARRFAPSQCIGLDAGAWMWWQRGRLVGAGGTRRLTRNGQIELAGDAS